MMTEQFSISSNGNGSGRTTHRSIRERWVITGTLVLETPAHFGSGETDDFTDMPVLLDESDDAPLLPGTSIAGALRNSLREYERGDGVPFPAYPKISGNRAEDKEKEERFKEEQAKERDMAATLLFGGYRGDDEGDQSPLVVHDARGKASGYELRDGVAIDAATRTAALDEKGRGKKFDIQLLAAGTTFDLQFELAIGELRGMTEDDYKVYCQNLLEALAVALDGLASSEIHLGGRKRRGYGQCSVDEWTVRHYDLTTRDGLLAWLVSERDAVDGPWYPPAKPTTNANIAAAMKLSTDLGEAAWKRVQLRAAFAVDGSVLIRSGFGESDSGPDMVHLHSPRADNRTPRPIIPGTSWAGILRHRATRIARTVSGKSAEDVQSFIDSLFGPAEIKTDDIKTWASRLSVAESVIRGGQSLVQTRVKIDRFTGGAFETALFSEQPLYGKDALPTLDIQLRSRPADSPLDDPEPVDDAEVGLLLLLLKDLWTGDLPVGGEASVGRGRLQGLSATLIVGDRTWEFERKAGGGLAVEGGDELQVYVDAFNQRMVNHD